jgi:DNA polymerase-3 subunit delta
MNTYALLAGTKVVALKDARVFHGKADAGKMFEAARRAHAEGAAAKAAAALLAALGLAGISLEDLAGEGEDSQAGGRRYALPDGWDAGGDDAWLGEILGHCRRNRLEPKPAGDDAARLEAAIRKGFPEGHHLILATDRVDRRRGLYQVILETGVVIDGSVPAGERKADREAQTAALLQQAKAVLAPRGQSLSREGFAALCEMTGFSLGVFTRNLEILSDFAGGRREITAEDVAAALTRTKKDPLFEFTSAVTDRHWETAFARMASLLEGDMHPLQLLSAVVNQVRKLLAVKAFLESPAGAVWRPGTAYAQFQKGVLPAVVQHERERLERLAGWERDLAAETAAGKRRGKARAASDLTLVKNPASAYPVYQLFNKAERFSREELLEALERLSEADIQLKSSTVSPHLALERAVGFICGGPF